MDRVVVCVMDYIPMNAGNIFITWTLTEIIQRHYGLIMPIMDKRIDEYRNRLCRKIEPNEGQRGMTQLGA